MVLIFGSSLALGLWLLGVRASLWVFAGHPLPSALGKPEGLARGSRGSSRLGSVLTGASLLLLLASSLRSAKSRGERGERAKKHRVITAGRHVGSAPAPPHPSSAAQLPPLLFLNKESGKFLPRVQRLLLGIRRGDHVYPAARSSRSRVLLGGSAQVTGFPCWFLLEENRNAQLITTAHWAHGAAPAPPCKEGIKK